MSSSCGSGSSSSSSGFIFQLRTQFSFIVDDRTLSHILSGIAKQAINITGYLQTVSFDINRKSSNDVICDSNIVRLVVGSPDSETARDLLGVREILNSLGVKFRQKEVIQVLQVPPGVPGIINGIFSALWRRVIVFAIYIGEETRLFIDVSDNKKALQILNQTPDE
jgi:hypothetical protein